MTDALKEKYVAHLNRVLRDIRSARQLHLDEYSIPLFLPKFTLDDMFQCDRNCEFVHLWREGHLVWRSGDLLAQASSGLEERKRQLQSEMLALRVMLAIDACNPDFSDVFQLVPLTGDLKADMKMLLFTLWYDHWFSWMCCRFGHRFMPEDFSQEDEPGASADDHSEMS